VAWLLRLSHIKTTPPGEGSGAAISSNSIPLRRHHTGSSLRMLSVAHEKGDDPLFITQSTVMADEAVVGPGMK